MRTENDYTETDLGNISPNPRGEYDEKASYEYLDLISYQGGSYLCLAEPKTIVSGIAPKAGQNTEVWQMIALPGELTPEYIAMHDDTIAKAKQTEASRTAAELAQEAAETARTDVVQMHSETLQAATEARENCDSSAGYAQAAELSRKAAAESEQNINAQVTGFETEVSESVTQATEQITTARQKAVQTITSQQDTSVQAVKDQTAAYISEKNTEAKKEITDHAEQEIVRINAQDSVQQIQKNKEDVALLKEELGDLIVEEVLYKKDSIELTGMTQFEFTEITVPVEKKSRKYYISIGSVKNCYNNTYAAINVKSGTSIIKSFSFNDSNLSGTYDDIDGAVDNIYIQLYRAQGQAPEATPTVFNNIIITDVKNYKSINSAYIEEYVKNESKKNATNIISEVIPNDMIYVPENLYKDGDVTLTGNGQWEYKNIDLDVSAVSDKPITVSLNSVEGAEYKYYCLVQFKDASGGLLNGNYYFDSETMSITYGNASTATVLIQLYRSQGNIPTTEKTIFHGISVIAGDTENYIAKRYIEKPVKQIVTPMISEIGNPKTNVLSKTAESMTGGDTIVLNAPDIKKGKTISFACNITEMGAVRLSHCDRFAYCSAVIEVTSDKVNYYTYGTALELSKTVEHGLTISDFLGISLNCASNKLGTNDACKVTIVTSNGNFTAEFPFDGSRDCVKANVVSGTYTNCVLSFFCDDYKKDVWAFGDSCFDMWTVRSVALGYGNFLIDGWSGRASKEAYESFEKLLALYPSPKKVLWCMGMNDADTDTEVNANWNLYFNKLKAICEEKNIEIILTTIPNVPARNHTFKNAIIRNSGLRYVDVCKTVGAETNSSWYNGLLSGDKVHPSQPGQFVIASEMIANVPEISAT